MGGNFYQDNKTAVDSEAIATVASTGVTAGRDEAVTLGGTSNRNNIGGEFQATGANSTITVNDPQVLSKALEALQENNESFSETLKDISKGAGDAGSATLDKALAKLTELAESKQTDGESGRNNTILWIALGILGVIGIYFYRRFK